MSSTAGSKLACSIHNGTTLTTSADSLTMRHLIVGNGLQGFIQVVDSDKAALLQIGTPNVIDEASLQIEGDRRR
jgi:hypothetical protein